ncbi:c-type cytochrome [Prosthecomicrobium sp. N25]|uniref:c-type cytochrome n=1 Tax=Prosthecomicrobium sp. N25 TaxID=3129254 RepID=UPI0030779239
MKKILALSAVAFLATVGAAAADDPANGEKVFNKCKACHAIGEGATNKVGPVLNGVIGRKAGTFEGYSYSPALKKAGEEGLVLTEENIAKWVSNPKAFVPGNKMSFVGLQKEDEVKDVIAYLASFDATGKKK